jgi:hypothetical protein
LLICGKSRIVFKENPRPRHFGFFSPRGLKWGYIRESKG